VPEDTYRSSRAAVLAGFLRRSSIYQVKEFVNRYEARARQNLEHALAALTG
jgi:predicted metal-dependent HD superfamily phosphohydrolase